MVQSGPSRTNYLFHRILCFPIPRCYISQLLGLQDHKRQTDVIEVQLGSLEGSENHIVQI